MITKLKERRGTQTHTQLKCGQIMTVSTCSMECGPAWLTFNGLFGEESKEKKNSVYFYPSHGLQQEPEAEWHEEGGKAAAQAANGIFNKFSRCLHKSKCVNVCRGSICHWSNKLRCGIHASCARVNGDLICWDGGSLKEKPWPYSAFSCRWNAAPAQTVALGDSPRPLLCTDPLIAM